MNGRQPVVYIVDDDPSVCRAFSLLVRSHGFKAQAFACAADFLSYKHSRVPSCLLLDIRLPDMNGLALQEKMAALQISVPIVFVTGHGDIPMSVKGMKAGAVDFLPKPVTAKKLLAAVDYAVAKNKAKIKEDGELARIKRRISTLSAREREVFALVARGMLSKQVARKLGTALQTIKVHRSRVMRKMQATTVTELIGFARTAGIIPKYN